MEDFPFCLTISSILFLIVFAIRYRLRKRRMKHGEILPSHVMKDKYGLSIENYKPPITNPKVVPENLRDLLPLAEKWGIADDIIRNDFQEKASDEEKKELVNALDGKWLEITEWLDSFGTNIMPLEAALFMYMQLGYDEMKLYLDEE